jgi:uncharacterized protein
MNNTLVWFDLPVKDFQGAVKFYSTVMGVDLQTMEVASKQVAFFPCEPGVVSGCLVEDPDAKPGAGGPLVYLNGGDDLAVPLSRVKAAGGSVVMEKTHMGAHGFTARFKDPEGNILALHSRA